MSDNFASLRITGNSPRGHFTHIELNGVDISAGLRSVHYRATSKDAHRVTLELEVEEVVIDGEMRTFVSPLSADILERLGWTPPTIEESA